MLIVEEAVFVIFLLAELVSLVICGAELGRPLHLRGKKAFNLLIELVIFVHGSRCLPAWTFRVAHGWPGLCTFNLTNFVSLLFHDAVEVKPTFVFGASNCQVKKVVFMLLFLINYHRSVLLFRFSRLELNMLSHGEVVVLGRILTFTLCL